MGYFDLPEPETKPCDACGQPAYGAFCEECRTYFRQGFGIDIAALTKK